MPLPQVSPDLRSADPKTISRGITVLSNSQSYVKSFDGMAYELKGKLKEGTSTDDIQTVSHKLKPSKIRCSHYEMFNTSL